MAVPNALATASKISFSARSPAPPTIVPETFIGLPLAEIEKKLADHNAVVKAKKDASEEMRKEVEKMEQRIVFPETIYKSKKENEKLKTQAVRGWII